MCALLFGFRWYGAIRRWACLHISVSLSDHQEILDLEYQLFIYLFIYLFVHSFIFTILKLKEHLFLFLFSWQFWWQRRPAEVFRWKWPIKNRAAHLLSVTQAHVLKLSFEKWPVQQCTFLQNKHCNAVKLHWLFVYFLVGYRKFSEDLEWDSDLNSFAAASVSEAVRMQTGSFIHLNWKEMKTK